MVKKKHIRLRKRYQKEMQELIDLTNRRMSFQFEKILKDHYHKNLRICEKYSVLFELDEEDPRTQTGTEFGNLDDIDKFNEGKK